MSILALPVLFLVLLYGGQQPPHKTKFKSKTNSHRQIWAYFWISHILIPNWSFWLFRTKTIWLSETSEKLWTAQVANFVFQKSFQWHLIHFILVLEKKSIHGNSLHLSVIVTFWTEISASKHQKCQNFLKCGSFYSTEQFSAVLVLFKCLTIKNTFGTNLSKFLTLPHSESKRNVLLISDENDLKYQ